MGRGDRVDGVTILVVSLIGTISSILAIIYGFYELGFKPQIKNLIGKFESLENRVSENTQKITSLETKVDMIYKNPEMIPDSEGKSEE